MPNVFTALPGLEVPVGGIASSLAKLWEGEPGSQGTAPSEFRASQMNVVLHFGLAASEADARNMFDTVVSFAQRYPCRVVILCPLSDGSADPNLSAKIFSECYIGQSRQEMSCCEFILLSYPPATRPYLENQVSICLEGDLPIFYWPHGIKDGARLADYPYLLKSSKRIIIDTSLEPADISSPLAPFSAKVRDLVYARLLPVRQSVGQFLSGHAPSVLIDGLTEVIVSHGGSLASEAKWLLKWAIAGLRRCGVPDQGGPSFQVKLSDGDAAQTLAISFVYKQGGKHFSWKADLDRGAAIFDADFGSGQMTLPVTTHLLKPEAALGEALFF
ncbi:MAG TPA: glucose-6-phosphate dehydrogenase assembly protein OpcA [Opitutaceae bacterium]|nr:glucose-6-phosphate dehydrogenase assembly protein OpcA [Opitutaceae bacterium]